ncbi:MAG: glutamate racemase [Desulfovibrionales bacterium]
MKRTLSIGLFDSGIGGLTVLAAVRRLLPFEDLIYFADSRHAPYGENPPEVIRERCFKICDFFQDQGVKAVVVACNTATAAAISELRSRLQIPVVGIEPGLKPAAAASRSKIVGILATASTFRSKKFECLVQSNGNGVRVVTQPCPGLVRLIEEGRHKGEEARGMVKGYLAPLLDQGADTIVLGCTHFPFIFDIIRELTQETVRIIETGQPVAMQLKNRLTELDLLNPSGKSGNLRIVSSGSVRAEAEKLHTVLEELRLEGCTVECGISC